MRLLTFYSASLLQNFNFHEFADGSIGMDGRNLKGSAPDFFVLFSKLTYQHFHVIMIHSLC